MNKGIQFTDEFKQDAVAQVVERGYAVSEVAERLTIPSSRLWFGSTIRYLVGAERWTIPAYDWHQTSNFLWRERGQ